MAGRYIDSESGEVIRDITWSFETLNISSKLILWPSASGKNISLGHQQQIGKSSISLLVISIDDADEESADEHSVDKTESIETSLSLEEADIITICLDFIVIYINNMLQNNVNGNKY